MRLIDADDLRDKLVVLAKRLAKSYPCMDYGELVKGVIDVIDKSPTVDAEPVRHGQWVEMYQEEVMFEGVYKCSHCGEMYSFTDGTPEDNKYNYCPHCGAKMDGGAENEQKY